MIIYIYKILQFARLLSTTAIIASIYSLFLKLYNGTIGVFINNVYDKTGTIYLWVLLCLLILTIILLPRILLTIIEKYLPGYKQIIITAMIGNLVSTVISWIFILYSRFVISNNFKSDVIVENNYFSIRKAFDGLSEIVKTLSENTQRLPKPQGNLMNNNINYYKDVLDDQITTITQKLTPNNDPWWNILGKISSKIHEQFYDKPSLFFFLAGTMLVSILAWKMFQHDLKLDFLSNAITSMTKIISQSNETEKKIIKALSTLIDTVTEIQNQRIKTEGYGLLSYIKALLFPKDLKTLNHKDWFEKDKEIIEMAKDLKTQILTSKNNMSEELFSESLLAVNWVIDTFSKIIW